MQYLMFVRVPETADPSPAEADPTAWVNDTTARGVRLLGDRLRPAEETATVRVVNGEMLVTDGPFAELREQIAGFDLIEVATHDEALAVAAAHPAARFGAIELRALWPFED